MRGARDIDGGAHLHGIVVLIGLAQRLPRHELVVDHEIIVTLLAGRSGPPA